MTREAELELEIARLNWGLSEALYVLVNVEEALKQEKRYVRAADASRAAAAVRKSLSTQPSTTALQELIEEVERRTIERCANAASEKQFFHPKFIDEAIRALPTGNLKLEDL